MPAFPCGLARHSRSFNELHYQYPGTLKPQEDVMHNLSTGLHGATGAPHRKPAIKSRPREASEQSAVLPRVGGLPAGE
jgi:hypothetical protein